MKMKPKGEEDELIFLGITALEPPAYRVNFLPLYFKWGESTFRSERSLENENSEAVQMQTLAADLFINSLEEHHELQKEGNFPPQVCCLTEHSDKLEFAFLHTRRPVAENEVKSTNTGSNAVK